MQFAMDFVVAVVDFFFLGTCVCGNGVREYDSYSLCPAMVVEFGTVKVVISYETFIHKYVLQDNCRIR